MHPALPQLAVTERYRRSFRLLTFMAAIIGSFAGLLVTTTQTLPLGSIVNQTESWWWRYLGLPSVLTPILLGLLVVVGYLCHRFAMHRLDSSGKSALVDPLDKASTLERIGWRICEVYLVLFPLTVALLPMALRAEQVGIINQESYHIVAMYSMVATILASVALSGSRRWAYVALIHIVTALTFLSATRDLATSGLFILYSLVLSVPVLSASLALQSLAYAVDNARALDAQREAGSALLQARLAEAERIDTLVHDHILSALLLTSRVRSGDGSAESLEVIPAVRRHSVLALDALEDIATPQPPHETDAMSAAAFHTLLVRQVRALDPAVAVLSTGSRHRPIPGDVAHAIVAAACEALRNSLRHSGTRNASGAPVTRRLMLHFSDLGLTSTITDDGSGFDPSAVSQQRLGVRGSIMQRMKSLPGGSAQVDSTIGEGTRVSLAWAGPQVPADARSSSSARGYTLAEDLLDNTGSGTGIFTMPKVVRRKARPLMAVTTLLVLAALAGMAALTVHAFTPAWTTWVSFGIVAAGALHFAWGSVFSARGHHLAAWSLTCCVVIALIMGTATYHGRGLSGVEMWQVVAAVISLMILSLTRFRVQALAGMLACAAVIAMAPLASTTMAGRVTIIVTFALFVVAANLVASWLARQISAAVQMMDERAARHVRENEQVAALEARRERSQELDDLARPLLTSLAGGARLTPAITRNAALVEAELRNGLRGRCFRGTSVTHASRAALERGVTVELMDDGGLDEADHDLRLAVEKIATREISRAQDGSVTVRVLPPQRDVLLTILRRPAQGRLVRTELDAEAREIVTDATATAEVVS